MPRATHHRMQRIAQCALERIAGKPPVHLHVPDSRLDGATPFDHGLERSGDTTLLACHQDAHALNLHAPIALVYDGRGRRLVRAREDAHLLQCLGQCVTVIGIARHGAHAHHQTFLQCGGDADLHSELIGCPGLSFADAFHFRRVQGVQLVLVFYPLGQDAARAVEQVLDLGLGHLGQHVQLALHLAVYPANPSAQCPHRFLHAFELLGMRVAPDLRGKPWGHTVVVLAQPQPVVLGCLDQVLAALV